MSQHRLDDYAKTNEAVAFIVENIDVGRLNQMQNSLDELQNGHRGRMCHCAMCVRFK